MGRQLLGYENFADEAVLSGGSWQVPLSALQSAYVSERCRSTNLDLTSTQFVADLGEVKTFRMFCLTHTNLTASALYRLTWYDGSNVAIANSGWLAVNGVPEIDPDMIGSAIWHPFDEDLAARYVRCELDDETNTDTFVEAGRAFIVPDAGINRNPDIGAVDDFEPNTPRLNALGGTGFFNRRTPLRKYSFGYNVITDDADAAKKIRRLRRYCNLNKQVVIIPDPDDTDNYAERNFVGTLNAMPRLSLLECDLVGGDGFEILEVV